MKNKQTLYFGEGSISSISGILQRHKIKNIFLVTGKKSFATSGAQKKLIVILSSYKYVQFNDFSANPTLEEIERGVDIFNKKSFDIVIAVGGGSVIDTAKTINTTNHGKILDYLVTKKKEPSASVPLIAIPTTAGSGSEATQFAVVTYQKKKYSLAHETLIPLYAVVDPSITFASPQKIAAPSGIDALAQAVESYWSIHSTEESKSYARQAFIMLHANLKNAIIHDDKLARIMVSMGAHLAGKAINISRTTACHSVSYPITSNFGIPHGQAVALTLPSMFLYNAQANKRQLNDTRGIRYVQQVIKELTSLFGVTTAQEVANDIRTLMRSIGLYTSFGELGLRKSNFSVIIQQGFTPERVKNNPRILTQQSLTKMLLSLL